MTKPKMTKQILTICPSCGLHGVIKQEGTKPTTHKCSICQTVYEAPEPETT
jgi:uncharacterized Zn finger protein